MLQNDKSLKPEAFLVVCTALLLFLLTPWILITASPDDFNQLHFGYFFSIGLIYTFLYIFLALSILFLFAFLKTPQFVTPIIRFAFFWVILAAFLFPLAQSTEGMVDPRSNPTDMFHFFLVFVLSFLLLFLTYSRFKTLTLQFLFAFAILNSLSIIYGSYQFVAHWGVSGRKMISRLSKEKNIIVLCLDGLPGNIVSTILQTNTGVSRKTQGLCIFPKCNLNISRHHRIHCRFASREYQYEKSRRNRKGYSQER